MSTGFFGDVAPIRFEGPQSDNPLAFRHYQSDRMVLGKTMAEHLRPPSATGTISAGTAPTCSARRPSTRPWFGGDDGAARG